MLGKLLRREGTTYPPLTPPSDWAARRQQQRRRSLPPLCSGVDDSRHLWRPGRHLPLTCVALRASWRVATPGTKACSRAGWRTWGTPTTTSLRGPTAQLQFTSPVWRGVYAVVAGGFVSQRATGRRQAAPRSYGPRHSHPPHYYSTDYDTCRSTPIVITMITAATPTRSHTLGS
jgi:hypothetical protein